MSKTESKKVCLVVTVLISITDIILSCYWWSSSWMMSSFLKPHFFTRSLRIWEESEWRQKRTKLQNLVGNRINGQNIKVSDQIAYLFVLEVDVTYLPTNSANTTFAVLSNIWKCRYLKSHWGYSASKPSLRYYMGVTHGNWPLPFLKISNKSLCRHMSRDVALRPKTTIVSLYWLLYTYKL